MVDENKLYKLLVEPCDPGTKEIAKALYNEIVEALKTAGTIEPKPAQDLAMGNKAVFDKAEQPT